MLLDFSEQASDKSVTRKGVAWNGMFFWNNSSVSRTRPGSKLLQAQPGGDDGGILYRSVPFVPS